MAPQDIQLFLIELFDFHDADNSGFLERDEALCALDENLQLSDRDAVKCIQLIDVDQDGVVTQDEWRNSSFASLVAGILDVREKQEVLRFLKQVLRFAQREYAAAICQAKVMLKPRVKNLEALVGAATYQYKNAARTLVKQKCSLYKSASDKEMAALARNAAKAAENDRLEAIREKERIAEFNFLAADIEAKRRLIRSCKEAAVEPSHQKRYLRAAVCGCA